MTRHEASAALRDAGYVHAHSNRYARTKDKGRGVTWATLIETDGVYRIEWSR